METIDKRIKELKEILGSGDVPHTIKYLKGLLDRLSLHKLLDELIQVEASYNSVYKDRLNNDIAYETFDRHLARVTSKLLKIINTVKSAKNLDISLLPLVSEPLEIVADNSNGARNGTIKRIVRRMKNYAIVGLVLFSSYEIHEEIREYRQRDGENHPTEEENSNERHLGSVFILRDFVT